MSSLSVAPTPLSASVSPPPLSSHILHHHHHHHHHHQLHHLPSSSSSSPYLRIKSIRSKRCARRMASLDSKGVGEDVCSGTMIYEPIMEDGVYRFDCSPDDRNSAFPSISFLNPSVRDTPLMIEKVPSFIPTFGSIQGQQIVQLELPVGTTFYGTGEVSGQLERTGKRVFTWNTDAWGYGPSTTSLYQSHPWVLAILPNGEALGVLADTTRRCEIDLRKESTIKFVSASPYPAITFGPFASPTDVLVSLSQAVGTVFMPPKWALGYHQCRWSYASDKRVLEVARTFREKGIPCDVIWMDIDYMDGFRCFTFDRERFPDPQSLVNDLHRSGFKAIWMLDPGIKQEKGYFVYDSGSENDIWVQTADGRPFVVECVKNGISEPNEALMSDDHGCTWTQKLLSLSLERGRFHSRNHSKQNRLRTIIQILETQVQGDVWPGPCVFPDYTQSNARSWWANLVKDFLSNGVDGIWNDMNEPAVFKVVSKTMPESNIHAGDHELGGHQNHSFYHNVYGMLMARSTYEGMKGANERKRPFVLTRAGFMGSQRYAATWTGDNLSTWEHLHMSASMVLQLSLSGQPLSGPDIGGFAGNATPKLFGRWMGIGAMFPFCRGHSETDTVDHEPWSFGEECEEVCRLALRRRYQLMPHIYTLFYLAHTRGTPVASPTFFADPKDLRLRTAENSFLLGPLLIQASTLQNCGIHQTPHLLPKGIWLSFDFDDSHPDLPALYLQGGSIIPMALPHQHVGEANPTDDVILLVALDENGRAEGVNFEDDGDGYEFTKGNYLLTNYIAQLHSSTVTIEVSKTEGSWKRPKRRLHVQLLLGGGAKIDSWGMDGEDVLITMPSEHEVSQLISQSQKQYLTRIETAKSIPEAEETPGKKGTELSKTPIELKSGDWCLKVVPWIGGRIIAMEHQPTGIQWLHSRVEINGYEEYTGVEYRSPGCTEEYAVIARDLHQAGEEEALKLEADVGGGIVLERYISIPKGEQKVVRIQSSIVGRNVGAGSGGFSRLVCLRVHPTFSLLHPMESLVTFTAIDGSKHEIRPDTGEQSYEGDQLPNGEWMLVDNCLGVSLVNRFDVKEVYKCVIHWGTGTVNLELWSEQRPVSKQSPLTISHEYEVQMI